MQQKILRIGLFLAVLVGLNVLASFVFMRWDATQEKRYTISDATRKLLKNLDGQVLVKVYLTGDFPPGFERLEGAVRETLESFKTRRKIACQIHFYQHLPV